MESIILSLGLGCDTKMVYMERWKSDLMEFDPFGKCLKSLIDINFFLKIMLYKRFPKLIDYYNIIFSKSS